MSGRGCRIYIGNLAKDVRAKDVEASLRNSEGSEMFSSNMDMVLLNMMIPEMQRTLYMKWMAGIFLVKGFKLR